MADLNGDGNLDLATPNSFSDNVSVLLGNGNGTFQPAQNVPTSPLPLSLAVGDLNSDGTLDLAVATRTDTYCYYYYHCAEGYVNVLLGNGDGTFTAGNSYFVADADNSGLPVELADIDGDGKLDAVIASHNEYSNNAVNLFRGNGDGTLNAPEAFSVGSGPSDVAVADLNGDAFLDIATANFGDNTASVLLNDTNWPPPGSPSLSISDVTVTEGNTGTVSAVFTVNLSAASDRTVTVTYSTSADTATAGSDYTATSGTLTFDPGVTSQTVAVVVNGDRVGETDESFFVNLDNPTNATFADAQGVGTILDDEPRISISDVAHNEGNAGTTSFNFIVSLSAPYDKAVTVSYATADGTATVANKDYQAKSGSVTFAAGVTSQTVTILVNGDKTKESDETFYVNLSNAVSALIMDSQGAGTILNDERGGKGKAPTADARLAPGVEDLSAAPLAGGTHSPSIPAARPAVAPWRKASAVDQVFAVIGAQAQQIRPKNTKGHARATDPWADLFANDGLLWNESVPGGIVF
jgi:hypothetical protein